MDTLAQYETKKQRVLADFQELREQKLPIALGKNTSNLFRSREGAAKKLDVRDLDQVISVDREKRLAVVEGMCPFEELTKATLAHGMLPAVVPELKTITVGGGVSGVAIESSSFRFGLVHEMVEELEILTGTGEVVVATRTNQHKALLYGFPNSYGTLGYILKLTVRLIPAKPFVHVQHTKFTDSTAYFKALKHACTDKANDYVDGCAFTDNELYLTTGRFVDTAPYTSSYTYRKQYFRSIQNRTEDYLTAYDYIWRWDKDWFWCSKHVGMDKTLVRLTAGLYFRGSKQYWKVMQWNRRHKFTEKLQQFRRKPKQESVIQDVQIPIARCAAFLTFFFKDIKISPVWFCPVIPLRTPMYPLYELPPGRLFVNFGFWDTVPLAPGQAMDHHNVLIEEMVTKLGGRKSLYSDAYYTETEFWKRYNKKAYDALKKKYDIEKTYKGLYEKTVKRK